MESGDIVPRGQDFATVGHLYRSIEAGFAHLVAKHGEDWLFVGPPRAQATAGALRLARTGPGDRPGLGPARHRRDPRAGRRPRAAHWQDAHFGQFVELLDEYRARDAANPGFEPARPVLAANVRPRERDVDRPADQDPVTARG